MKNTAPAAGQLCPAATSAFSRVRKYATAGLLVVAVFGTSPAFAKDPCKTALCMGGLLKGSNDSECREAIQEYFDIVAYKKKKRIDWSSTAKQRLSFTNSCPGSDQGINKKINDKFGKSRG
jgi:hypothetical protein